MKNYLVSVIIPCYNSEKFISETIQSVQSQTYENWEIILVDDASTDKTISIINEIMIEDNRIQLFKLNSNSGTGIARNFALTKANGRYISFLDSVKIHLLIDTKSNIR